MARTSITVQTPPGPFVALPVSANSLDTTWQAADPTNKNSSAFPGRLLVKVRNDDASSQTFTITSSVDSHLRTGDIGPYTLGAGEEAHFIVQREGFVQSDGLLYLEASDADVKFAIVAI